MKKIIFLVALITLCGRVNAQGPRDPSGVKPVIKSYPYGGVFMVKDATFKPDPSLKYKVVVDLTVGPRNATDSMNIYEMNWGFGEVARKINLHAANGIPLANLEVVVAVHNNALNSMLSNEAYKKKYGVPNPSVELIEELKKAGVKIIVCGQSMYHRKVTPSDLIPGTEYGLTAQTIISSHHARGFLIQAMKPE